MCLFENLKTVLEYSTYWRNRSGFGLHADHLRVGKFPIGVDNVSDLRKRQSLLPALSVGV